ncbi:MAG: acyltransferase [Paracoccaceae bacterium]
MHNLSCSDTSGRNNNLSLVRLVAALAVIWGHSYALVQTTERDPLAVLMNGHTYSGTIAVSAFFALSGFLVTRSYWFKPNIADWVKQRIARIYPGVFVCLIVMLVYVFVVYRREDGLSFFNSEEVWEFMRYNMILDNVRFKITGAFPDNRITETLNGSWWTLPGEIRVYLLFAILALVGLTPSQHGRFLRFRCIGIVALLAGMIVFSFVDHPSMPVIMNHTSYASPTRYFLLGCIAFYLRKYIVFHGGICIVLLALPYIAYDNKEVFLGLLMFSICYTVFYIGFGLRDIGLEGKIGDYSYGIYIYGWFAQQVAASLNPGQSHYENFLLSATLSIFLGWLSWRLVESPSLDLAQKWRPRDPRSMFRIFRSVANP